MKAVQTVNIGKVAQITSGFAFKSNYFSKDNTHTPLIRIRDVTKGFTNTYYSGDFQEEFIVKRNNLLIGMDGEFKIAKWASGDALLNQRVCKIQSSDSSLRNDYLYYLLPAKLKKIEDKTPFVTVKHLSVKTIKDIEIPLPPLKEQKRIVKERHSLHNYCG